MKFTLIKLAAACAALLWAFAVAAEDAPRIGYVRPLVGTDGFGNVYPGAQVPFGGIQISPDTDDDYYDAASGYKYAHKTLMGFSLNHLSGTVFPIWATSSSCRAWGNQAQEPGTHDDPGRRLPIAVQPRRGVVLARLLRREPHGLRRESRNDGGAAQRHPALHLSRG